MRRGAQGLQLAAATGAMALMLISTVTPVEAQAFRLAIDEISVTTPTDGDGEDDVYFKVVGATSSLGTRTIINIPEIRPAPPESFYRMGWCEGTGRVGAPVTPALERRVVLLSGSRRARILYRVCPGTRLRDTIGDGQAP